MTAIDSPRPELRTTLERRQQGFTLIELMIIVAVIGILASIAIPVYSNYTIRAMVSEGIVLSSTCKNAISEGYQVNGLSNVGFSPDGWGCNEGRLSPGTYVNVVHTDMTGAIYVTMNPNDARLGGARGQDIILAPVLAGGNNGPLGMSGAIIGWTCLPGPTMPPEYMPSTCR